MIKHPTVLFFLNVGIFAILSGNFWYPLWLELHALTPMEVLAATATFWKKRDGEKGRRTSGKLGLSPCSSDSVAVWAQCGTMDLGHVQQS